MKCTDSDVSLVLSRSQYVHENTKFSLQSFLSNQFSLLQCYIHFVMGNGFLHIFLDLFICKTFLSLSLPCEIFCLKPVLELAHMQFSIQSHYIHMSRYRKATIRSKWTLFCVCLYVCNDPEWETLYK